MDEPVKPIKYHVEFSELDEPDVVIAHYVTSTPFIALEVCSYVNLLGLPNTTADEYWTGKTFRIERMETGIYETDDHVVQKLLVQGNRVPQNSPYRWNGGSDVRGRE